MIFADYHTHTNFSSDSNACMIDMIEKAYSMGLKEIAITDHIDFDFPDPEYPFLFKYNDFRKSFDACYDIYRKKINVLCGVELGLQPHVKEQIDNFADKGNFDFIIGSTHCVDKYYLSCNNFFENKTKQEAHNAYLDEVLNSIKIFDCFNVYGHIDFINRYGKYEDKSFKYCDNAEKIDEILKTLISKGKGIEINTSGLRYGVGSPHPHIDIVKRYKELGGEIITIGSDAHRPEHIAKDFNIAYEMLDEAGFKYLSIFRNRKPDFINLNNLK